MTNNKAANIALIIALIIALAEALTGPPPPAGAADRPLKAAHVVKLKNDMRRYPTATGYAYEPVFPPEAIPFPAPDPDAKTP